MWRQIIVVFSWYFQNETLISDTSAALAIIGCLLHLYIAQWTIQEGVHVNFKKGINIDIRFHSYYVTLMKQTKGAYFASSFVILLNDFWPWSWMCWGTMSQRTVQTRVKRRQLSIYTHRYRCSETILMANCCCLRVSVVLRTDFW